MKGFCLFLVALGAICHMPPLNLSLGHNGTSMTVEGVVLITLFLNPHAESTGSTTKYNFEPPRRYKRILYFSCEGTWLRTTRPS